MPAARTVSALAIVPTELALVVRIDLATAIVATAVVSAASQLQKRVLTTSATAPAADPSVAAASVAIEQHKTIKIGSSFN